MTAVLQNLQHKLATADVSWQVILVITVGLVSSIEGYISGRQKPYLDSRIHSTIPAPLRPYLPSNSHETFTKSQSYALDKLRLGAFLNQIDLVESFLLLTSVAAPFFLTLLPDVGQPASKGSPFFGRDHGEWTLLKGCWDLAEKVPTSTTEIRTSLAFVAILTTLGTILSLPKDYYRNFVLEEKHGFNKMTRKTFFLDAIKGFGLTIALELPLIAGILRIIEYVGPNGVLRVVAYVMALIVALQLIMIPLFPYVIAPLFNKFTPLPENSPVFPRVKALAERLNFPLGKVWVIDGSKRSSHSNAYFYGLPFLTKQIVIYDTLIEKSTPEEIEAILAHELGHWHGKHVLILLSTSIIQTAFSLFTFTLFLNNYNLLSAFGFRAPAVKTTLKTLLSPKKVTRVGPTIISLMLASQLFAPLNSVLHFLMNTITRKLEYDADQFAVKLGSETAKNLKGALVSIHRENLAIYGVDPVYSAYNHSHPTLVERLEALDKHLGIENSEQTDEKAVETKKDI